MPLLKFILTLEFILALAQTLNVSLFFRKKWKTDVKALTSQLRLMATFTNVLGLVLQRAPRQTKIWDTSVPLIRSSSTFQRLL